MQPHLRRNILSKTFLLKVFPPTSLTAMRDVIPYLKAYCTVWNTQSGGCKSNIFTGRKLSTNQGYYCHSIGIILRYCMGSAKGLFTGYTLGSSLFNGSAIKVKALPINKLANR